MDRIDIASLLAEPAPLSWDRLSACNAETPGTTDDPLSQALPWLVRHLGVAEALQVALTDEELALDAQAGEGDRLAVLGDSTRLLPALQHIGFDARLVQRELQALDPAELPLVLLLRGGDACVLTELHRQRRGPALLNIVMPGQPPLRFELPLEELAREYTGMALTVRPTPGSDPDALDHLPDWALPDERAAPPAQRPLSRLALALRAAFEPPRPLTLVQRLRLEAASRLEALWPVGWTAQAQRWFKFANRRPISG